jgi:diguanylate cyclase (GGDEF)-like protein
VDRTIIERTLSLLLLMSSALYAQEYSFRTFGNAEGLNNLAVREIYQDRAGFIWVSTENGIFRYDGDRFEAFGPAQGIPATSGAALGEAPDGSLLAGGNFGLYRLLGNRFEKLAVPFKTVSWAQGIQSDGKGHTFLGTDSGLVEFYTEPEHDGFAVRNFPQAPGTSGPQADAVLVDGDVVWYGCGQELCRMDANGTRVLGKENGLPGRPVLTIRKDGNGDLWVRPRNSGVFVLPAGQSKFRRPDTPIATIAAGGVPGVDSDGRILLPSPEGLLIKDKKGWLKIDQSVGLRGVVYAVLEDRQHSLWIGLAGRGLAQWRGYQQWETYSTASGLSNDIVYEIQRQGNGTLWVGTEGGLLRAERGQSGIRWNKVAGLSGFAVHSLRLASSRELWAGTESHGVARLDIRTGRIEWVGEAQGLLGKAAYTLRFDHQRRLWAATEVGLFLAKPPYRRFSRVAELPPTRTWAISEGTDGAVWVGGAAGLFSYADGEWKNFTSVNGLSNQEVMALGAGTNGTIWIGYRFGGGIDRVHLQAGSLEVEKSVQRPGTDGLVYFLELDPKGRLWAGTEQGVDMWDGARWSHYDMSNGLAWNDCNLNSFAEEPDGTVWIGTSAGLSRFKPRPSLSPEVPIKVVFTKLVMGRKDVSGLSNPSSDIHANSLIARYSALNVAGENGVLFRYQLQGSSSTWRETTQRELEFAELAPGAYRLEVEAQGSDGVWSDKAEFAFQILTPWYRSWWFVSLCVLAPVFVAGGVVRLRILAARRRERELQELKVANDEIRNLAFFDPLTGLPNRRLLLDRLRQSLAASHRSQYKRALLFLDLDDFKTLNDTLGHHIGDLLLQEVARRITATIRETDTVARLGGDEFVVLLEALSEIAEEAAAQSKSVAEKILAAVDRPYLLAGRECRSSSSIGITVFGDPQDSTNEVLQQADIAMYHAKAAGRNNVRFFAPALQAAVNARAAMEEDLRQAIKINGFLLYYQAQVDRGVLVGAEALIRWRHPQRGFLSPGEFIPLAEKTGLILPLGDWVLETVCKQIAAWAERKDIAHITVAVNISAGQLRNPDFVEKVMTTLDRTRANPQSLKLELTESMFVDNVEDVIAKMTELKSHGLRFSLDDFGTGYSSLAYLRRLPLDQLKIDQAFVRDILKDAGSGAIAESIISLGRAMGLSVIAEGVETEEQRDFLAGLGCHAFQGYLFSRPVPVDEFQLLLPGFTKNAALIPQKH